MFLAINLTVLPPRVIFTAVLPPSDISVDYGFTYPNIPNCETGDVIKVFIGLQVPIQEGKKHLSEAWPVYDIVVTLRFLPGQHNYTGSTRQRITTKSYGSWRLSYIVEDVETIPLNF
ncbi:22874_t:CDS:2, partial [Dentiscutata erythropus]